MQKLWSHRGPGRTRPFMLLDELDSAGTLIQSVLTPYAESIRHVVHDVVTAQYGNSTDKLPGLAKLDRNSVLILSGVIIGCLANAHLRSEEHTSELQSLMRISYDGFCLKKK